jgi:hypothetical protein
MNSNRRVMRTKLRGSLAGILTAFCAGSAAAVLLLILGYVMRAGIAAINLYLLAQQPWHHARRVLDWHPKVIPFRALSSNLILPARYSRIDSKETNAALLFYGIAPTVDTINVSMILEIS